MSKTRKASEGAVRTIADDALVMVVGAGGYQPVRFADLAKLVRETLQIGGRNLLMQNIISYSKTSLAAANGKVNLIATGDSYFYVKYADISQLKAGENYVISLDCEGLGENDEWTLGGKLSGGSAFSLPLKNGRNFATFILTENQIGSAFMFDDTKKVFPNGIPTVILSNFQLERGNVATDFRPAPEDLSDLWGGVIGYLPITYNLAEKGGQRHEQDKEIP